MCRPFVVVLFGIGVLLLGSPASAQTPDSFTPAVEEACTKYEGEGARHGLCIAYCEAQDCDNTKGSNPSCGTIEERFISYSVRQGYVKGPKEKPVIACKVTACSAEDAKCGGKEADCDLNGDRKCEQICTVTSQLNEKGDPVCVVTKCKGPFCVGEKGN
jgi:hypothetical protein